MSDRLRRLELDEDVETLKAFASAGKPVVIEETFVLFSGADGLRAFLRRAKPYAAGVIGFYWGQTPADLKAEPSIGNAIVGEWLKIFSEGWNQPVRRVSRGRRRGIV